MKEIIIRADSREGDVIDFLERIILQEGLGIKIEVERLTVGDFLLSDELVVERKRGDDFVATFTGRERESEFLRMIQAYPRYLIILESWELAFFNEYQEISLNSVYGMLSKVVLDYAIPVVPTNSIEDTARFLIRSAIREQREKELNNILVRHAPKMGWLDSPDPEERKKAIREHQAYFLQGLVSVGPKLAWKLLQEFHTPYEVIAEYGRTTLSHSGSRRKFNKKTRLSQLKGVGVQNVYKNRQILLTDTWEDEEK